MLKSECLQPNAMINLLGQHYDILLKNIYEIGSQNSFMEKKENKYNRKIGHLNILDNNLRVYKKK